jgi:hypothetical protein
MKNMLRVTVAVLLTAVSVHSASAQAPALTNADVTRLVAVHVSDQTVIAAIHEAKATQFDLSATAVSDLTIKGVSPAVIVVMRQSAAPTPVSTSGIAPPAQSPMVARPQTIAEASAEAKKITHAWPISENSGSGGAGSGSATAGSTSAPVCAIPLTKMADNSMVCRDAVWFQDYLIKERARLVEAQNTCCGPGLTATEIDHRMSIIRVIEKFIDDRLKEAKLLGFTEVK